MLIQYFTFECCLISVYVKKLPVYFVRLLNIKGTFFRIKNSSIQSHYFLNLKTSDITKRYKIRIGNFSQLSRTSKQNKKSEIFYLPNPSARTGYDTRSIFKRILTGLNSVFSFS